MNRKQTDYLVLCCSDTPSTEDIGLKELDSRDRRQGWFKCVYHFVIRRSGEIQKGYRDWAEPSMSLHKWNATSVAICLVGGKGENAFSPQQIAALKELLGELQEEYPEAQIIHHHELNPKIPNHGVDLIAHMKEII